MSRLYDISCDSLNKIISKSNPTAELHENQELKNEQVFFSKNEIGQNTINAANNKKDKAKEHMKNDLQKMQEMRKKD